MTRPAEQGTTRLSRSRSARRPPASRRAVAEHGRARARAGRWNVRPARERCDRACSAPGSAPSSASPTRTRPPASSGGSDSTSSARCRPGCSCRSRGSGHGVRSAWSDAASFGPGGLASGAAQLMGCPTGARLARGTSARWPGGSHAPAGDYALHRSEELLGCQHPRAALRMRVAVLLKLFAAGPLQSPRLGRPRARGMPVPSRAARASCRTEPPPVLRGSAAAGASTGLTAEPDLPQSRRPPVTARS